DHQARQHLAVLVFAEELDEPPACSDHAVDPRLQHRDIDLRRADHRRRDARGDTAAAWWRAGVATVRVVLLARRADHCRLEARGDTAAAGWRAGVATVRVVLLDGLSGAADPAMWRHLQCPVAWPARAVARLAEGRKTDWKAQR